MNLVLADTEEFRRVKRKQNKPAAPGASGSASATIESEEKRTLGLTIVRGAHIISLSVESPPPADPSARLGKSAPGGISSALAAGPGVARPAGRGAAPPSLAVCDPYSLQSFKQMLTVARALPLALVVFPLLDSPVSLAVLLASLALVVVVVSSPDPDTLIESLTISKLLPQVSLETSLLQLASPEALSSPLPDLTPVVPHLLDSSLLPEDRLYSSWTTGVIPLVKRAATISITRLRMSCKSVEPKDLGHWKQLSRF